MLEPTQELKQAVESLHNCQAIFAENVWVVERFQDKIVWEGNVALFVIKGHPDASLCYAWSSPIQDSDKRKYYAVLQVFPIQSAEDAVRASIVRDFKENK